MSSPLANNRFQVFSYPTPSRLDLLFYEVMDRILPANDPRGSGGTYGDAHWDSASYPNHKLVFRSPSRTDPSKEMWWYAADRANQDEYNWAFVQADLGGVKFDAVERMYFYKRSDFAHPSTTPAGPTIEQGEVMPNVPSGKFPYTEYILAERQIVEAPEELRSLYIMEKRVYVRRVTIYRVEHEEMLGVGQGSSVTLYYRGETPPGGSGAIETLVATPSNAYWGVQNDGTVRTGEQLTFRWFAVTTYASLDDALAAYKLSFPSSVDMDLPDELIGVTVVWNQAGQNGVFNAEAAGRSAYVGNPEVSLSLSESANAECGGALQPEIIPTIRSRKGRDVPCTMWFFYIKSSATTLSAADVLAKLATLCGGPVSQWPMFQPSRHTFVLMGQRGSARAQVSASGSVATQKNGSEERNNKEVSSAKGKSFDLSTTVGTVVLPETIHGEITVDNASPSDPVSYTANCSAEWNSFYTAATVATYSIALPIPAETGPGNLDPTPSGTTGSVSEQAELALDGSVSPTYLAATSPAAIPTSGLYMVGAPRIEPYRARWFRCSAQVVDASVFTP